MPNQVYTGSRTQKSYECNTCETNEQKQQKGYMLKRLKCEYFEKKFNKKDTFDMHVKKIIKSQNKLKLKNQSRI